MRDGMKMAVGKQQAVEVAVEVATLVLN